MLTDAVGQLVPLSLVQAPVHSPLDFDLEVCGVLFAQLLKRAKALKPNAKNEAFLDLNVPITDADFDCDFSSMNIANQKLFNQRIKEAASA